ncbi:MAG: Ig-like domain-containing protein [Paludibacteraceae bacterium]|nr:Ig-like domain-containing protein [Paludibacteraceae bacterium]
MKKYFYFMSLVAMVAAMAACGPKEEEGTPEEQVEPQKITIAEAYQEFNMAKGETMQISYSIAPTGINVAYTLVWKSDDEDIATVDNEGNVTAVSNGTATISVSVEEYPDVKKAEAVVTVLDPIAVGDYIYSDGSWGKQKVVDGKSIIAVVYWVGNPTLFDPILESEYPNCTHGLAMSLKQGHVEQWQKDFHEYWFGGDGSLDNYEDLKGSALCNSKGSIIEYGFAVSSYSDLLAPYLDYKSKELWTGGMFCGIGGYTITAIMEEYTKTDPDAAKYPLQIYTNTMDLVKDIETPLTTSRWYVPSLFETALMVNTALTKPADFNNTSTGSDGNPIVQHNNYNVAALNSVLSSTTGADQLPTDKASAIASASDAYFPFDSIFDFMPCGDFFELVVVTQDSTGYYQYEATYKDAVEKGKTEDAAKAQEEMDKRMANETRWYKWLTDNAGDDYAKYEPYKTTKERIEIFVSIRGLDPTKVTYEKIGSASFVWALSLFGTLTYANVGVADGKLHNNLFVSSDEPVSGAKGTENPKDVVRAVIAF